LDAGTGTLANLQHHIGLDDVGAVAVSHRHFDHFLDLYPFFLARWLRRDPTPLPKLPLFAPPGMFEHALQLEDGLGEIFDVRAVEPGDDFQAGPLRVQTAPMRHPVRTLGMRIEANGAVLAYSADTGPTDELVRIAKGSNVLLCEATFLDPGEGSPDVHLSAGEAGEHAARAGAGRLVLTHIWPTNDRSAVEEQARSTFGGPVLLAREGLKIEL
jgi:ribonuclease BN (tRNA processing enzyme)